jgi:hypothetical protein
MVEAIDLQVICLLLIWRKCFDFLIIHLQSLCLILIKQLNCKHCPEIHSIIPHLIVTNETTVI